MKKILILIMFIILTVDLNCGGGGDSPSISSKKTLVKINLGETRTGSSERLLHTTSIPSSVVSIRFTISASDMQTIERVVDVAGRASISESFEIPNGSNRHFVVEAFNAVDNVLYRGETYANLDGNPVILYIIMVSADTLPPDFSGLSSIGSITTTSMVLSWSSATDNVTPQDKIQYLIYMASASDELDFTSPSFTTNLGATSYTVTGLNPDTTYKYVVRAMDEVGNIDNNVVVMEATTLAPPDTTPPSFEGLESATALSSTEIELQWSDATDDRTSSSNITYLIYMATSSGGQNFAVPNVTTSPGVTNFIMTGLSGGTTYYFVVRARDEAGNIETNTTEQSATTLPPPDTTPPSVPTGLAATAVSTSQINLSWNASTDNVGVTGYNVYRDDTFLKSVTNTSTSDTGLSPDTEYCYNVSAYDAAGNESSLSEQVCATTQSAFIDIQPINDGVDTLRYTIFCDVANNGTLTAMNVEVYFDYNDGYYANCESVIVSVPPGSTQPVSIVYDYYPLYYRIIVDPNNLIIESDETNNCVDNDGTFCLETPPTSCGGAFLQ